MDVYSVFLSRQKVLDKKINENDLLQSQIDEKQSNMITMSKQLVLGQEALQFLEDVANSRRGAMRSKIEQIITEALRMVYGSNYTVELAYDVKNNRSFLEIKLVVQTSIGEVKRSMEGFGGGVSDTISIPLRLLVLVGCRKTDLICILDEAYKHVGLDQIESVARFLSEVSSLLGVQMILSSHHEVMGASADVVFSVRNENGKSIVKKE